MRRTQSPIALPWVALPLALRSAQKLEALLGIRPIALTRYVFEVNLDFNFMSYLAARRRAAVRADSRVAGWVGMNFLMCLYALVRLQRPRIMVETGVGPGSTAAFVLRAMQRNGTGRLISVDLPNLDAEFYPTVGRTAHLYVPAGFTTGWQTHPETRGYWDLRLGDATEILPEVLRDVGNIDIFLHDSLHTYEHMMFEYTEACLAMRRGGLLLSDDVSAAWSTAFVDFCTARAIPFTVLGGQFGVAKVSPQA